MCRRCPRDVTCWKQKKIRHIDICNQQRHVCFSNDNPVRIELVDRHPSKQPKACFCTIGSRNDDLSPTLHFNMTSQSHATFTMQDQLFEDDSYAVTSPRIEIPIDHFLLMSLQVHNSRQVSDVYGYLTVETFRVEVLCYGQTFHAEETQKVSLEPQTLLPGVAVQTTDALSSNTDAETATKAKTIEGQSSQDSVDCHLKSMWTIFGGFIYKCYFVAHFSHNGVEYAACSA